jgi:hypothetical protein
MRASLESSELNRRMTLMANVFRSHLLACCVAGVLFGAAAEADVTMQEQMSLSGAGMMKMANMSGTTTTVISKDRARTESNMQFESAMMRTFARMGGPHVEIVRLDQDKIYSLDPKKKTKPPSPSSGPRCSRRWSR